MQLTDHEMRIQGTHERRGLILWCIFVVSAAFIGDSIIFLSTIKYKAINLPKVVVTVIQHLAIADLLQTVFRVLPAAVALVSDRWTMGEVMCHLDTIIGYICNAVTMLLTCVLSVLKFLMLKYPLRSLRWWTLRHKICALIWIIVFVFYVPKLVMTLQYGETLHFSFRDYTCSYGQSHKESRRYILYGGTILTVLALTVLIVSSVLLLVLAHREAGRRDSTMRWEGVVTVTVTVGVLLVSYLPVGLVTVTAHLGVEYSATTWRAVQYLQFLNVVSNFFVYYITVESFRTFLNQKISDAVSFLRTGRVRKRRNPNYRQPRFSAVVCVRGHGVEVFSNPAMAIKLPVTRTEDLSFERWDRYLPDT